MRSHGWRRLVVPAVVALLLSGVLSACGGESPPPRSTPDRAQRCDSDPRTARGVTARAQVLCLGTPARVLVSGTRASDKGVLRLTVDSIGPAPEGALTPALLGGRATEVDLGSVRMVYVRGEFAVQSRRGPDSLDSYSPFDLTIGLQTSRGTERSLIGTPPGCRPGRVGDAAPGTSVPGCTPFLLDRDDRAVAATFDYSTAGAPGRFAPDDELRWARRR